MMKLRLTAAILMTLVLLTALGVVVAAKDEAPTPYAGMKNPTPWDDAAAQQAGKTVYQQSCLGCHGVKGDTLPTSNFGVASYSSAMPERADVLYWLLSEGRMDRGMPPFKSTLSETQRWQVLTYISLLGKQAAAAPTTAPTATKPAAEGVTLQALAPKEATSGKTVTLYANLRDAAGKPISNATVKFFSKQSFFANGLMELGDTPTGKDGNAKLDVVLPQAGSVQIVARYENIEASTNLTLTASGRPYYRTNVGIKMPTLGRELSLGPVVQYESVGMGQAPGSALRLPGGALSWLLLPLGAVLLIWSTYFYVTYQVLRIAPSGRVFGMSMKTVPYALLVAVAIIGLALALKIATGPYSQMNIAP